MLQIFKNFRTNRQLEQENIELKDLYRQTRKEKEEAEDKIFYYENLIQRAQTTAEQLTKTNQQLEVNHQQLQQENTELQEQLASYKQDHETLTKYTQIIQTHLDKIIQEIEQLPDQLENQ